MGDTMRSPSWRRWRQGREIIKKLWALGMMEANINRTRDLDTATLIASEFEFRSNRRRSARTGC
jgi:hypothetical protein